MHRACSPAHVKELVVYWMALGSLDCLCDMALAVVHRTSQRPTSNLRMLTEPDIGDGHQLGELAVDRDSLARAFDENPESLQILLDELSDTLEMEISHPSTGRTLDSPQTRMSRRS